MAIVSCFQRSLLDGPRPRKPWLYTVYLHTQGHQISEIQNEAKSLEIEPKIVKIADNSKTTMQQLYRTSISSHFDQSLQGSFRNTASLANFRIFYPIASLCLASLMTLGVRVDLGWPLPDIRGRGASRSECTYRNTYFPPTIIVQCIKKEQKLFITSFFDKLSILTRFLLKRPSILGMVN